MLRRFGYYLEDLFEFSRYVNGMTDRRVRPRIETGAIWLAGFLMFVFRVRSLNALESQFRNSRAWKAALGSRMPSADTIARGFSSMSVEACRRALIGINRKAWRNKAIHPRPLQSHRVVAVDGHELMASRVRCCDYCLVREVRIKSKKDGKQRRVKEYYHRVVVSQWVGCTPPPIVDMEMVHPKEGEVVAAKRLLERLFRDYSRLIDVITADALYLEAPFIQMVTRAGKHVIIVMKQEARDLFKDADALRSVVPSKQIQEGRRTTRLWDLLDLTSFRTLGQKVRVVWAEETKRVRKQVPGSKPPRISEQEVATTWIWVTTLPATVPATRIQQWGHDRWDLENRGFNELVTLWNMDHCFVHNPNAIEVFLITLAIAFVTTYLFFERNLKPQVRPRTRLVLASAFLLSFASPRNRFAPSG